MSAKAAGWGAWLIPAALLALVLGFYGKGWFASEPAPKPKASNRAEIARIIQSEVRPLKSRAEVDAYLNELEARARRKGEVSALEVEPGLAALSQLGGADLPDRHARFTSRMFQLQQSLSQKAHN